MCLCIVHWSGTRPLSTTLANIQTEFGRCERVYTVDSLQPASSNDRVELMVSSVRDCGPALNCRWVGVVLTCSGQRHQLEIVRVIEIRTHKKIVIFFYYYYNHVRMSKLRVRYIVGGWK